MPTNYGTGEDLRVHWMGRRSNQLILKEINPEYSLEGLKLKLQYFGHLMWRTSSSGEDPDAERDWRQEKGVTEDEMVERHHQLNAHESEQTPGDCERQGGLACCWLWDRRVGFDLASKQQWTTIVISCGLLELIFVLSALSGLLSSPPYITYKPIADSQTSNSELYSPSVTSSPTQASTGFTFSLMSLS